MKNFFLVSAIVTAISGCGSDSNKSESSVNTSTADKFAQLIPGVESEVFREICSVSECDVNDGGEPVIVLNTERSRVFENGRIEYYPNSHTLLVIDDRLALGGDIIDVKIQAFSGEALAEPGDIDNTLVEGFDYEYIAHDNNKTQIATVAHLTGKLYNSLEENDGIVTLASVVQYSDIGNQRQIGFELTQSLKTLFSVQNEKFHQKELSFVPEPPILPDFPEAPIGADIIKLPEGWSVEKTETVGKFTMLYPSGKQHSQHAVEKDTVLLNSSETSGVLIMGAEENFNIVEKEAINWTRTHNFDFYLEHYIAEIPQFDTEHSVYEMPDGFYAVSTAIDGKVIVYTDSGSEYSHHAVENDVTIINTNAPSIYVNGAFHNFTNVEKEAIQWTKTFNPKFYSSYYTAKIPDFDNKHDVYEIPAGYYAASTAIDGKIIIYTDSNKEHSHHAVEKDTTLINIDGPVTYINGAGIDFHLVEKEAIEWTKNFNSDFYEEYYKGEIPNFGVEPDPLLKKIKNAESIHINNNDKVQATVKKNGEKAAYIIHRVEKSAPLKDFIMDWDIDMATSNDYVNIYVKHNGINKNITLYSDFSAKVLVRKSGIYHQEFHAENISELIGKYGNAIVRSDYTESLVFKANFIWRSSSTNRGELEETKGVDFIVNRYKFSLPNLH